MDKIYVPKSFKMQGVRHWMAVVPESCETHEVSFLSTLRLMIEFPDGGGGTGTQTDSRGFWIEKAGENPKREWFQEIRICRKQGHGERGLVTKLNNNQLTYVKKLLKARKRSTRNNKETGLMSLSLTQKLPVHIRRNRKCLKPARPVRNHMQFLVASRGQVKCYSGPT